MFVQNSGNSITGLYVHVPFCDGKCSYCAFYSIRYSPWRSARYLDALEQELACAGKLAPKTIYLGGGTPSVLSVRELESLLRLLRKRVSLRRLREWTIEINPGSLDAEKVSVLMASGVNRFSLGAQSFDERILKWLERRHRVADTVKTVKLLRDAGAGNISLDLIAGVPGLTRAIWRKTLLSALTLEPNHISAYALTNEEGTRLNRRLQQGKTKLLPEEKQLTALDLAETILTAAGFRRYEISNYAKSGFECLHNVACWRGEEYIGLGPAAASHVGLERWTNRPDLSAYCAALATGEQPPRDVEKLTPASKRQERVIFGLRLAEGIAVDIAAEHTEALSALQAEGLVARRDSRWVLTRRGVNLADYVAVELIK